MSTEVLVLTGPESSGKTTLARQLSHHWGAPLVSEVAREYLGGKQSYRRSDLLEIARQQRELEQSHLAQSPDRLICDTDLLVIMIWSEVKYGQCDPWIYSAFEEDLEEKSASRFYYLCDCNIPWQADPLRENPDDRGELFDLYLQKLKAYELSYSVVEGTIQERLQRALGSSVS